jgi:hypothetical protein
MVFHAAKKEGIQRISGLSFKIEEFNSALK